MLDGRYRFKRFGTSGRINAIEFSITDICNRNCRSCSHFAPLAKKPNFIHSEDFEKQLGILKGTGIEPDSVWLTGGEPTLHPNFLGLLKTLREIFPGIPVGMMSNGSYFHADYDDPDLWNFVKENGIIWHITTYDTDPRFYEELFERHGCINHLSLDVNNTFVNLINLSHGKEITQQKYARCGWERLNTFIRNGRIYKCPSCEYIDLFNEYFGKTFEPKEDDYLIIDENLTYGQILKFKSIPSSFCGYCEIDRRYKDRFTAIPSERKASEWMI